ncbi:NUDIX hydrolase [Pseudogracilibacillus auburnensis]|uniref:ADP-ribose pyrophosphatase n=1 Tax=Pseudogracilibacillus auburnensis TaxID=1494959 RepID=A0A2V3W4Q6_9BACI|nr:NUDIX hydrolase [Pseudogracilibacillus auburnensis]MBO1003109.1 NUDIX hydrolase [Pseudogracilibacillus auburnensis]PXW88686.1 ADP-ribose pyrophosphatase [Pseudogracilibacillus auburnensis]
MKKFEEKTTKTEKIFDGKIISVQVDDVLLPDGNKSKREIVKHPGAVAIIPVTSDGKIIFVEQYRKPLERSIIEIPAGKIEPNEDPTVTAIRELEEETGYTTKSIQHISSFYTSPGFADELIHLYYTEELIQLEEMVQGDEDEFIQLITLTLEEAEQYIVEKKIYDAKTILAIQYVKISRMDKQC